eukprot:TRINITY_DN9836_c0_g1_i1.p2 TRINITY_DN9836_c0_g1~~TRINITY_DN9836_c0_g1_i1.p2  ORF type:complete len:394 (-),score=118.16 TRINITY_DN9836_c0_g1_i1:16-1197(-)
MDDDDLFLPGGDEDDVYSWEKEYQRSWEALPDDTQQQISELARKEFHKRASRRLLFQSSHQSGIRRGMTRYLVLVLDLSSNALLKEGRHTRQEIAARSAHTFVSDYHDQNPISHLALVFTRDAVAQRLTDLSGTSHKHIAALKNDKVVAGEPSLQNSLLTARKILAGAPWFGVKEVLVLYSSLNTRDPGDVFATIEQMREEKIRVSVVGFGAEVFILKRLCDATGGIYGVGTDAQHYHDLVLAHSPPPPAPKEEYEKPTALIRMGFPRVVHETGTPSLCACHMEPRRAGMICPQCHSKCCEIPTECPVCGLVLLSSTHLARSYHHLFPVPIFSDISGPHPDDCFSCLRSLSRELGHYQCPQCCEVFCIECDAFIHEKLHNCPGCEIEANYGND